MTVREYSLKFVKLSMYATSLVSNSRDEMSRFLTGTNGDLYEDCSDIPWFNGIINTFSLSLVFPKAFLC